MTLHCLTSRRLAELVLGAGVALIASGCEGKPNPPPPQIAPYVPPPGARDLFWGTGGVVISDPSPGADTVTCLVSDSTANFYTGGTDESAGAGDSGWRLEKRSLGSGALDITFGTGGALSVNPSTGADRLSALGWDGFYLYLVGFDSGPGDRQWRIEKRQGSDGQPDTGFGTLGVVTSNPSAVSDEVTALLFDGNSLYVAGFDESAGAGDSQWRIEKRRGSDGALVAAFGSGGVVTSNPSSGADRPVAATWDGTYLYIAGFDSSAGNRQWRIEKRQLGDGSLVSAFGTGGVLASNPSTGGDEPRWLLIRPGSPPPLFVAGFDESAAPGDTQWRVECRSSTSGSLVAGFGVGGVLVSNPSSGLDELRTVEIAIAPYNSLCLLGVDASPNPGLVDRRWRVEMRDALTGAPRTSYGQGGVATSDPSPGDDTAAGGFRGAILAGTDFAAGAARWRFEAWKQ